MVLPLSSFQEFLLLFGKEFILTPLLIVGFVAYKRRIFGHGFALLLFAMVFNVVLKGIFQCPLNPALGKEGFSFPSGHMHTALAFYGWLLIMLEPRLLRILCLGILGGVAWSLVGRGYHDWLDILGAFSFGGVTLFLYTLFLRSRFVPFAKGKECRGTEAAFPPQAGFALLFLAISFVVFLLATQQPIFRDTWMALYALGGFMVSWTIQEPFWQAYPLRLPQKICAVCITFLGIILVEVGSYFFLRGFPPFVVEAKWLLMGTLLPLSLKISVGVFKRFWGDVLRPC